MDVPKERRHSVKIVRWVARLWSILVFIVALMVIFSPNPQATEPVPVADCFLLSLWGVAILGLLVSWRWELVGGITTVAAMVLREVAWIVLKGGWLVNFLLFWLFVMPPAGLFLVAWGLERKASRQ